MEEAVYTLGVWRIKLGKEDAFIEAWKALGKIFKIRELCIEATPGAFRLVTEA